MPVDISASPKNVTATLYYLQRAAQRPVRYVGEPPPGALSWDGIDDPREVLIEDARNRETEFSLDRSGFTLLRAPTQVRDFYSPEEVKAVHYPEVERLLRDTLNASRVVVFDHGVRNAGIASGRVPSRRVHNDHSELRTAARARPSGRGGRRAAEAPVRHRQCLATDPRARPRFSSGAVRRPDLHGCRPDCERLGLSARARRNIVG